MFLFIVLSGGDGGGSSSAQRTRRMAGAHYLSSRPHSPSFPLKADFDWTMSNV